MARSKSDKAFDERVAQYSEELRELLTDLYGEQADEAFRNLTELMAKAHDARPADLKRLDTKRLADPEWYKRDASPVNVMSGMVPGWKARREGCSISDPACNTTWPQVMPRSGSSACRSSAASLTTEVSFTCWVISMPRR